MTTPGRTHGPHSLIGRLVLWVAVLFAVILPLLWFLFAEVADKISRDGVDARLLEFAERVRGYWVSVRAEGRPKDREASSRGGDIDWVWQVAEGGEVMRRSDLLSLTDTTLPVTEGPPTPAFVLKDVETPLGPFRIVERVIAEPPAADAGETAAQPVHYVVGLRMSRYLGYVEANAERLQPLALLAVVPVALALIALSAAIILATRRNLNRLTGALHAYEQGEAARVEGRFAVELQAVADRINALLARNEKLVERTRKYVSKITHDINHPLAVMKNALSDGAAADRALMNRQVERMTGLIDRYASLARAIGPEGLSAKRAPVRPVLDDITDGFSILYRRTPLSFSVACADDVVTALPRHDLEAMVSNLVSNAHKHAETQVRVSARLEADGALAVAVEDDGPGIPEAERAGVTDWGKRLDEAPPGTGFGLTIVRDIADLYEGRVALGESDLGGLMATITIPQARS